MNSDGFMIVVVDFPEQSGLPRAVIAMAWPLGSPPFSISSRPSIPGNDPFPYDHAILSVSITTSPLCADTVVANRAIRALSRCGSREMNFSTYM